MNYFQSPFYVIEVPYWYKLVKGLLVAKIFMELRTQVIHFLGCLLGLLGSLGFYTTLEKDFLLIPSGPKIFSRVV